MTRDALEVSLLVNETDILFVMNKITLFIQPASCPISNAEVCLAKLPGTKVPALQTSLFLKSLDWLCCVDAAKVEPSRMHKVLASLCIVQSSFINGSCNAMSFCHSAWELFVKNGLVLLFGVLPAHKKRDLIKLKVPCGSESNFDAHLSFLQDIHSLAMQAALQPIWGEKKKKEKNEWV